MAGRITTMRDEFVSLPEEFAGPPPEFSGLPRNEYIPSLPCTGRPAKKKFTTRLKLCLTAAAVSITTVATAAAAPTQSPATEYLDRYPLAYCCDSAEECERMIEDELWYQVFYGMPENGYYAPLYETFDNLDEFRDAVQVSDDIRSDSDCILGFSYYPYTIELPEGTYENRVYLLPEETAAILRLMDNGSFRYVYLPGDAHDIELNETYDVIDGDPQIFAFGNGSDIVGYWDCSTPEESVHFHITTEHTRDCGKSGFGILVKLYNTR